MPQSASIASILKANRFVALAAWSQMKARFGRPGLLDECGYRMDHGTLHDCLSSRARKRGIEPADVIGADAADFLDEAVSLWNDRNLQVTSGAARGALLGFAAGGYPGAVAGSVKGGFSASRPKPSPASPPSSVQGNTAPVPNEAALQLLAAILRPEMLEALAALSLGRHGATTIPVAGTPVPVDAFAGMLQQLASRVQAHNHRLNFSRAEEAWAGFREDLDLDDTVEHSEALLELLSEAALDDEGDDDEDEHMAMEWLEWRPWRR
jgi:hypothetical protein